MKHESFNAVIIVQDKLTQKNEMREMADHRSTEPIALKGQKKLISENGRLHDIKNDIVDRLKSDKTPCKYFYRLYLENIKERPVRSQNKWGQELGVQIDDWLNIYFSTFRTARNTKLENFQFKLSHRITATNSFLFKCALKETKLYNFSTETKDSLLHLLWECTQSKNKIGFHQ